MNRTQQMNTAILLLRVSLGVVFIAHSLLKLTTFTLAGTAQFFAEVGFAPWLAYPVTFIELIGGVLLIAGIATRYVAIVLIPILLGAVYVHSGNGWLFTNSNGGWEFPAFLTLATIVQVLLGDGEYRIKFDKFFNSADRLLGN